MGQPECILVNPVEQGPLLLGRHAARDGRHWYFSDAEGLRRVPRDVLRAPGASLLRAERLAVPGGTPQGLLAFRERLLVGLRRGDRTVLYVSRGGADWTEAGSFPGRIGPWCLSPDGGTAFLVMDPWDKRQPGPRPVLASTDGRDWQVFERILPEEAEHVHALACPGRDLVVLVGDAHFRHFRLPALDASGRLLPPGGNRPRLPLGLDHKSLFRVLPGPGGPLLALDGATELLAPDGTTVLRDDAPGDCGFQVAAHACFPWAPDILFFGTWRRSPQAPYPCFYALGNPGLLKFTDRSRPFSEDLAWTGYQDLDQTFIRPAGEARDERFWPCHSGTSLCLVPVDAAEAARFAAAGVPRVPMPSLPGITRLDGLPALIDPRPGPARP